MKTKYPHIFFSLIAEQNCWGITLGGETANLPSGLDCKEIAESKKTKRTLVNVEYRGQNWYAWIDNAEIDFE